eukprot:scaffold6612_cov44-Attheya_sp.AAC.4
MNEYIAAAAPGSRQATRLARRSLSFGIVDWSVVYYYTPQPSRRYCLESLQYSLASLERVSYQGLYQ